MKPESSRPFRRRTHMAGEHDNIKIYLIYF